MPFLLRHSEAAPWRALRLPSASRPERYQPRPGTCVALVAKPGSRIWAEAPTTGPPRRPPRTHFCVALAHRCVPVSAWPSRLTAYPFLRGLGGWPVQPLAALPYPLLRRPRRHASALAQSPHRRTHFCVALPPVSARLGRVASTATGSPPVRGPWSQCRRLVLCGSIGCKELNKAVSSAYTADGRTAPVGKVDGKDVIKLPSRWDPELSIKEAAANVGNALARAAGKERPGSRSIEPLLVPGLASKGLAQSQELGRAA